MRFNEAKPGIPFPGVKVIDYCPTYKDTCLTNEEAKRTTNFDDFQDKPGPEGPGEFLVRETSKSSQICGSRYEPKHDASVVGKQRNPTNRARITARTNRVIQEIEEEESHRRVSQRRALTHHTCSLLDTESISLGGSPEQGKPAQIGAFLKSIESRHHSPKGARRCLGTSM